MRYKFFVATLLYFTVGATVGLVGCKSTSQMAWWKSANKSDAESTALAHSAAPELPSEVAKRAERLAANSTSGGEAASFVPNLAPAPVAITAATVPKPTTPATGYPTTGSGRITAPFASTAANTSPAAYPTTEAAASHLGSIGMPYDPSAVPALSPAIAEKTPISESQQNRYATTSLPSNIPANVTTPIAQTSTAETNPSTNSRYSIPAANLAASSTPANATASNTTASNTTASNTTGPAPTGSGSKHVMSDSIAVKTNELAASKVTNVPVASPAVGGNRYAATTPVPSTVEVPSFPVTSASATGMEVSSKPPAADVLATTIAEAVPYRPGGTSSYPNSLAVQSPTQIATRPDVPVDSGKAQTPNGNASEAGTQDPTSTPSTRYR